MFDTPYPLEPAIQLPSYPVPDLQCCYYHLAHPDSIRVHVRCFGYSFDDVLTGASVPYEVFGNWAAKIGYALYLLAEDLEGGWLEYPLSSTDAAFVGQLRCYSGFWVFVEGRHGNDVEGILGLCEETLSLLDQVAVLAPNHPTAPTQRATA